ncbi:MAG: hypothetical protein F3741_12380 [Nitrospinae bacterium]|nr:hypothetical protein [Nitrospinota bacterium]MZH41526.1 hypothetical protein [Nitrospinota bacterium]
MHNDRKLIRFNAATGFSVVLEFGSIKEKSEYEEKIKNAGLKCETIKDFNLNFDQADLFMDMRSIECREQFDLDDWI